MSSTRVIAWAAALGLTCVLAAPAHAVVKTWDPSGGSFNWNTANNWDPAGVPVDADDVVIDAGGVVFLNTNTAFINSFDLTATTLLAQGFRLNIGTMVVRGSVSGTTGSVVINPTIGGGFGLETNTLRIASGGRVTLDVDGTEAAVGDLATDFGGEFRTSNAGSHLLRLTGNLQTRLNNNGTFTAGGGTTTIELGSVPSDINLDGEFDIGVVNVSSGATLEYLTGTLTDAFDGTMNIGSGGNDTAVLHMGEPWTIGPGGDVVLNNGELTGGDLTNDGVIRGHGSITTEELEKPRHDLRGRRHAGDRYG